MATFIQILLGIAILVAGRKLFWLFVAAVGFAVGIVLAGFLFPNQSDLIQLIIALACGAVGAVLALFLQQLAIGLAGFLVGGYAFVSLLHLIGLQLPNWLPFIIGGLIGAALLAILFDWAIMTLSSLAGAGLLVQAVGIAEGLQMVVFIVLFIVGFAIQLGVRQAEKSRQPKTTAPDKAVKV
ncbi:MAG: hypothetical protein AB1894_12075 [Chloroflexota bacterium]